MVKQARGVRSVLPASSEIKKCTVFCKMPSLPTYKIRLELFVTWLKNFSSCLRSIVVKFISENPFFFLMCLMACYRVSAYLLGCLVSGICPKLKNLYFVRSFYKMLYNIDCIVVLFVCFINYDDDLNSF